MKSKCIILCLILTLLVNLNSISLASTNSKELQKTDVIYVTSEAEMFFDSIDMEVINPETKKVDILDKRVLWIEDELINDFKETLNKRYNQGLKTVIISDLFTKDEIKEFYGFKNLPSKLKESDYKMSESSYEEGTKIGFVAYRCNEHDVFAHINVIDIEEDLEYALVHATKYDYSRLFEKDEVINTRDAYSWSVADSDTGSVTGQGITVDASLQLFYDTCSPDADGDYYYHSKITNESESIDSSRVGLCRTTMLGSNGSAILEYGPENQTVSSGSSVTYSLGFGIAGISYNPSSKVKIYKDSGGVNNRKLSIYHQPKNLFGFNTTTYSLISKADYVASMCSSSYYVNGTAASEGNNGIAIGVSLSADKD